MVVIRTTTSDQATGQDICVNEFVSFLLGAGALRLHAVLAAGQGLGDAGRPIPFTRCASRWPGVWRAVLQSVFVADKLLYPCHSAYASLTGLPDVSVAVPGHTQAASAHPGLRRPGPLRPQPPTTHLRGCHHTAPRWRRPAPARWGCRHATAQASEAGRGSARMPGHRLQRRCMPKHAYSHFTAPGTAWESSLWAYVT